jgi:hypothetical protein
MSVEAATGLGRERFRLQCRAFMLTVRDGGYPAEVATAMRQERMSEGQMETERWTRPQER